MINSTSPLTFCSKVIACWWDTVVIRRSLSIARIWSLSWSRPSLYMWMSKINHELDKEECEAAWYKYKKLPSCMHRNWLPATLCVVRSEVSTYIFVKALAMISYFKIPFFHTSVLLLFLHIQKPIQCTNYIPKQKQNILCKGAKYLAVWIIFSQGLN